MDHKIPTTFEMDGLFTEKDIADRHFVMKPCTECAKYSKHKIGENDPCPYCNGKIGVNGRYWFSLRTWKGDKKLTAADKRKLG